VLEPGRGAELPLRELLLQPIASDLAQRLHTRKGIDRITERANREGKRSGLRAGESDGWCGTFREGEEELVMVAVGGWGLGGDGNRIAEEDGRRRRNGVQRLRKGRWQLGRGGEE
jgi:hypothetical protein